MSTHRRDTWWHGPSLCVTHIQLAHTQLVHTQLTHTQLVLTQLDIDVHFAWQAWHLVTSLRGRRGTYGTGPALVTRLVSKWRRGTWWHRLALCVAGVALGDIDASLCVAGVALGDMYLHLVTSTLTLSGRRGTYGTGWWRAGFPNDAVAAAALCVAGVALGDIDCHFAWQAWHLATCIFTWWHRVSLCVGGVALGDIHLRFTWPAWYLVTPTGHVPLLHHLHFCVHCDMFVLDEIVVPASSVAIWHHIYIYICIHTSIHPSILPSIHPSIHTCIHTYMHTTQLVHTQLTRTYSSTHNLLHTNPSPSLFPFLLSPCHLYLSFAACCMEEIDITDRA